LFIRDYHTDKINNNYYTEEKRAGERLLFSGTMCSYDDDDNRTKKDKNKSSPQQEGEEKGTNTQIITRERRQKRDRAGSCIIQRRHIKLTTTKKPKKQSRARQRHGNDTPSGGIEALIPSLIGLIILGFIIMGQMGFRGRATTAGIDLGTTNSVICVQAPSKGVGEITCIPDLYNGNSSPIIPSVVSFLGESEEQRKVNRKKKGSSKTQLVQEISPPPSQVVVGQAAKDRIESHPHQTVYHAKRLLGRSFRDPAVVAMQKEVEFGISGADSSSAVRIKVTHDDSLVSLRPTQVGAYIVHYMMDLAANYLGHGNVMSAVICVPAKFTSQQRIETANAFRQAGVKVTRVIEEPTAAALAYGLHKKEGVEFILVYDFGGGTLDVSLLHVTEGFADVMGSDGDELLGGSDFDVAIAHFLAAEFSVDVDTIATSLKNLYASQQQNQKRKKIATEFELEEQLMEICPKLTTTPLCTVSSLHTIAEKLKIQLSSSSGQPVSASCFVSNNNNASSTMEGFCDSLQKVPLTLTLEDFDKVVAPLYHRSVSPIQRLLKDLTLSSEDVDEVVMVGGTTRMPQIRELVKKELQISTLNTRIDPDLTVAIGAASIID